MYISCTKENLAQALSIVGGITTKNVNLPILNNILIKADNQKVELVATNLELAIIVNLRAKVDEPGSFTVPGRTLSDFVGLLSGEKVEMQVKENELSVTCDRSTTKIKGTPADEFPVLPTASEGNGYLVEAANLKTGLSQVIPAMSRNDIRPELSGVYFGFNTSYFKGLIMASTDSYRLAEKKIKVLQGEEEKKVIVPGRTAQEINRILSLVEENEKNVRLLVSDNQLVVNYNSVQMISRLVDGQYPDYAQIIPKEFVTTASFSTDQLTKEIKAAGLFTTTGVNAITFAFSNSGIKVSSVSTQTGEYQSEMPAEITGPDNSILLNHRYLLDGLNNLRSDRAIIKLIGADSPCAFVGEKEDGFLYIVMPIRQ